MKRFWKFDIDNKIATYEDGDEKLKLKFEVKLENGSLSIESKEKLENTFKNQNDVMFYAKIMRIMGEELSLFEFADKIKYEGLMDSDGVQMYNLEDNIYLAEDGEITVLNPDGFYGTDIFCDIPYETEYLSISLIKLLLIHIDDLEDFEEELENGEDFEKSYLTFNEAKQVFNSYSF